MKRLLFIVFTFLFITNLTQGSDVKKIVMAHEYKGTTKLSGTDVGGGKILVDNAYKQHLLMKKAKQWADEHYETGTAMLVNKTVLRSLMISTDLNWISKMVYSYLLFRMI